MPPFPSAQQQENISLLLYSNYLIIFPSEMYFYLKIKGYLHNPFKPFMHTFYLRQRCNISRNFEAGVGWKYRQYLAFSIALVNIFMEWSGHCSSRHIHASFYKIFVSQWQYTIVNLFFSSHCQLLLDCSSEQWGKHNAANCIWLWGNFIQSKQSYFQGRAMLPEQALPLL